MPGALAAAGTGVVAIISSALVAGRIIRTRSRDEAEVSGGSMKVEVLYFEGCPNHDALFPRLRSLLADKGVDAQIELRRVESVEAAKRERFLGSPTVRIDGEDIDPGASERSDFGLKCRLYRTEEGTSGIPPEQWIAEAIRVKASQPKP